MPAAKVIIGGSIERNAAACKPGRMASIGIDRGRAHRPRTGRDRRRGTSRIARRDRPAGGRRGRASGAVCRAASRGRSRARRSGGRDRPRGRGARLPVRRPPTAPSAGACRERPRDRRTGPCRQRERRPPASNTAVSAGTAAASVSPRNLSVKCSSVAGSTRGIGESRRRSARTASSDGVARTGTATNNRGRAFSMLGMRTFRQSRAVCPEYSDRHRGIPWRDREVAEWFKRTRPARR